MEGGGGGRRLSGVVEGGGRGRRWREEVQGGGRRWREEVCEVRGVQNHLLGEDPLPVGAVGGSSRHGAQQEPAEGGNEN